MNDEGLLLTMQKIRIARSRRSVEDHQVVYRLLLPSERVKNILTDQSTENCRRSGEFHSYRSRYTTIRCDASVEEVRGGGRSDSRCVGGLDESWIDE